MIRERLTAIRFLCTVILCRVERVRMRGTTIRETLARIRLLATAIRFRRGPIPCNSVGVRVRRTAIRVTLARIRSLRTLIREHWGHVQHVREACQEGRQRYCVQGAERRA